jgi:hypothetical protein
VADNIIVLDSIMGSGKTTYMLNYLNDVQARQSEEDFDGLPERFIYVTPTLAEVDRVVAHCPTLRFHDPEPIHGRKLWDFERLIAEGQNVCTTHALFSMLTRDIYELLRERNYTLIIDEVVTCVDLLRSLKPADRKMLFDGEYVRIGERDHLVWNHTRYPNYKGRFDDIRNLCDNGNLVAYGRNPDGLPTVLIWEFPADFLRCFEQVYILTYLFYGSPMISYFHAEGLAFTMKAVRDGRLMHYWTGSEEGAIKARLREIVTIYEGPMNDVGAHQNQLSATWFKRPKSDADIKRLRQSTINFFERIAQTPSAQNAWTTFKDAKSRLTGKGYGRGFISLGTKATNDHIEKRSVAYLANIFHQPVIKGFFEQRGIFVHEEMHALCEMIQWIWRSGIRRGDPIHVFVPSKRMRNLLKTWLESDHAGLLWEAVEGSNQADAEIRASKTSASPLQAIEN